MNAPPGPGVVTIAAPAARRWLEQTGAIRVLNRFDRAVNLADMSGAVLALVRDEAFLGPFAAVVPELRPSEWQAGPVARGALPSLDGSFAEWDPRPDWEGLRTSQWVDAALAMATRGDRAEILDALGVALGRDDSADAAAIAQSLAGVGGGLTPEGDDALVGAMYAVWATRSEEISLRLCAPLADAAAPRTTVLSAEWLRAAARGEAAAPWHALLSALAAAEGARSPGVDAAWQGVLAMGATREPPPRSAGL